ncbi:MAG: hypothetical protein ACW981_15035 [Candidatus Hodarchaeales archaeon]|jgi:hypothetical protein
MDEAQKKITIRIFGVILMIVGFYIFITYGTSSGKINFEYVFGAIMGLFGAFLALFYGRPRARDRDQAP